MPLDDHWVPRLRLPQKPAETQRHSASPVEAARRASPPVPVAVSVTLEKDQSAAPRGWRFVPLRDQDDRIVEIIATPI